MTRSAQRAGPTPIQEGKARTNSGHSPHEPQGSADVHVCRLTGRPCPVLLEKATGKSPEPAGWKARATEGRFRGAKRELWSRRLLPMNEGVWPGCSAPEGSLRVSEHCLTLRARNITRMDGAGPRQVRAPPLFHDFSRHAPQPFEGFPPCSLVFELFRSRVAALA